MKIKACAFALIYFFFAQEASAHTLDVTYLELESVGQSEISATMTFHPDAAYFLVGKKSPDLISAPELVESTLAGGQLLVNNKRCDWTPGEIEQKESQVTIKALAKCEGSVEKVSLSLPFLNRLDKSFRLFGKLSRQGQDELLFELRPLNITANLEYQSAVDFSHMIWLGAEHIGAAPSEWRSREGKFQFPDGIDHILFLLALILAASSLRAIILSATGFTIGHSITLALALLKIVQLPTRLVESLVAASIAIVAAEIFLKHKNQKLKLVLASFFGLIHGLGFAAALGALNFSKTSTVLKALFGFNIGVELGQLFLILIIAPVVLWLTPKAFFSKYLKPVFALIIFLIGSYWFLLRAFAIG